MTNPYLGIIKAEHKTLFNNIIDAILEDTGLTVPVTLVFNSTTYIACSQCTASAIGNKPATGGLHGAPLPIGSNGLCPNCHGTNKVPYIPPTETYQIAVVTDYRKFVSFTLPESALPTDFVQTICRITLLPKLLQAKEIIVSSDVQGYIKQTFQRVANFSPEGLGENRYTFCTWERTK